MIKWIQDLRLINVWLLSLIECFVCRLLKFLFDVFTVVGFNDNRRYSPDRCAWSWNELP